VVNCAWDQRFDSALVRRGLLRYEGVWATVMIGVGARLIARPEDNLMVPKEDEAAFVRGCASLPRTTAPS
jgi:hypothetical protein